jgi:Fe2+ transport system protein FeoA
MKRLSDVEVSECVIIKCVNIPGDAGERLMEMGLIPGTEVLVVRILYGLLNIYVRGYILSIRKEQADNILVE